jgi:hypothetical protein
MYTFKTTSKKAFLTLLISLFGLSSFAQDEINDLFKANAGDATKLIQAYMNPFFKGFGYGLNSGWNTTGAAKKFGRFEIRVGLTGSFIPEQDKTFDVTQIGLSNAIRPADPNKVMSPTIGGDEVMGPTMKIYSNNVAVGEFTLPKGAKLPFVPAPQVQASVGLLRGIDVTLRYVPEMDLGSKSGSVNMLGGGIKVNLLRLFAGKMTDKIAPFDLAASVGYTSLEYRLPLNVQKPGSNYTNQNLYAKFTGMNYEAIISKKILFLTPFFSLAYQKAENNVELRGVYPFQIANGVYTDLTNPVQINGSYKTGLRANLGLQMNITFLRVFASYSTGDYKAFNAGLGIGIGK